MEQTDIERTFNESFQKLFSKTIHLHKIINDEDVILMHALSRQLCIVDRNDIPFPEDRYLQVHNTPSTHYNDPSIRTSPYSQDIIVYPYINFKNKETMQAEQVVWVSRHNKFLNNFVKASLILKLHKENNTYYMEYWMNNKIIDNMLKHKREHKCGLFTELVCSQSKTKLIEELECELQDLLTPHVDAESVTQRSSVKNLLKDSVTLFDYQKADLDWMRDLEDSIDNGTNTFTHTFPLSYPVFNNSFVLFNTSLYPAEFINEKALSKTLTITYNGGNLISEIGLGKTIVSLYHILSHVQRLETRAIYNQFVSFGDTCNYAYKRGAMKGKTCTKQCFGSLYCTEHKKSLFIEKRNLIYKNLEQFKPQDFTIDNLLKTNATLILCPNQLCDQWVKEYYDKFVNDFRVLIVVTKDQYTNLKLSDILFADIIIVSYQFLVNEYYQTLNCKRLDISTSKEFCSGPNCKYKSTQDLLDSKEFNLFKLFHWRMIFLDEAHEIQNMTKSTLLCITIKNLQSKSKWNITGTPFANGVNSFVNLVSHMSSFKGSCRSLDDIVCSGMNSNLVKMYKKLFRRNTKQSINKEYSGTLITETMHKLDFTQHERSIYDSYIAGGKSKFIDLLIKICCHSELYEDTKDLIKNCKTLQEIQEVMLDYNKKQLQKLQLDLTTFENLIEQYQDDITKFGEVNIYNELQMVGLKIQLATAKRKHTSTKTTFDTITRTYNYLVNAIQTIEDTEETCPICLDIIDKDEKSITKCGHKFCWSCIQDTHVMKTTIQRGLFKCPTCNTPITHKDIFLYTKEEVKSECNELQQCIQQVKSTKIGNIIYFLKNNIVAGDKVILFSQWDELLHKVGGMLQEHKFKIVYCNGTVFQRKRAIQNFMNPSTHGPSTDIILLSSRNAASGINLTEANKIILLEPVYGSTEYRASIESQAIGRADRIGQKRPIEVHRFIIKDTIEEDIINGNINDTEIRQLRM